MASNIRNKKDRKRGKRHWGIHDWFILNWILSEIFITLPNIWCYVRHRAWHQVRQDHPSLRNLKVGMRDAEKMLLVLASQTHVPPLSLAHMWETVPQTKDSTSAVSISLQQCISWLSLLCPRAFCQDLGAFLACKCHSEELENQYPWGNIQPVGSGSGG